MSTWGQCSGSMVFLSTTRLWVKVFSSEDTWQVRIELAGSHGLWGILV